MKCPKCGAEVDSQRFCIYCGERLQPRENSMHVQKVRAHSGVMRFRHHASISQAQLPQVSTRQNDSGNMKLASLESIPETHQPTDSACQSRELEALLKKLNGNEESSRQDAKITPPQKTKSTALPKNPPQESATSDIFQSIDVDLGEIDNENVSLDDAFFLKEDQSQDQQDQIDASTPIPLPSGTFSRSPSGGFRLIVDSIKSACKNFSHRMQKMQETYHNWKRPENHPSDTASVADFRASEHRRKSIMLAAIVVAILLTIILVAISSNRHHTSSQIASNPQKTDDTYLIQPVENINKIEDSPDISTLTFDESDFILQPAAATNIPIEDDNPKPVQTPSLALNPTIAPPSDSPKTDSPQNDAPKFTQKRLYDRHDNVYVGTAKPSTVKIKRTCVLREGPASRFGFIKNIPSGSSVKILTTSEENWTLNLGGVWTKANQSDRLGPGPQFADAVKGMKLPQPKSRVISSDNWRYVQIGDIFGYVGPACFKK